MANDTRVAWPHFYGYAPAGGPRSLFVPLTLILAVPQSLNFYIEEAAKQLEYIQGVWIDNKANAGTLTISVSITQQVIKIPTLSQATMPLFSADQSQFDIVSSASAAVGLVFVNVPLPPCVWASGP